MGPLLRIAFIGATLCAVACLDATSTSGAGDSQYLKACDTLCGNGLSCVCGVCTTTCDAADDCSGRHAASSCVSTDVQNGAGSCGATEAASVCDFDCGSDGQCDSLGDGFECVDGFCRGPHVDTDEPPVAGGDGDGVNGSGGSPGGDGDGSGGGGIPGTGGNITPGGGCLYEGRMYFGGDNFTSSDGCNQCYCDDGGGIACTQRACAPVDAGTDGGTQPALCSLSFDVGPCDAAIPVWHHNPLTGLCEMQTYGGCGGNDNRFDDEDACSATCLFN